MVTVFWDGIGGPLVDYLEKEETLNLAMYWNKFTKTLVKKIWVSRKENFFLSVIAMAKITRFETVLQAH